MKATKKQRKAMREYIRWVADSLELRDWTISVVYDPPCDEDAFAHVLCTYGRKRATVTLCHDFFDLAPEKQRHAIAHELLHLHLSGIEWQFNNLQNEVSRSVFDVMWGGLKDQIEFGIDAMADAVAKHLPLPKWAEGKAK